MPFASRRVGASAPKVFSAAAPPTPEEASELASMMPPVAGCALEPPRFHETDWKVGQVFTSRDDPDRTQLPWQPPGFALNPTTGRGRKGQRRGREVRVEDLVLPDNMRARGSFARVVRGALTQEECAALIAQVNAKGFTPALLNVGMDRQQLMPVVRDGHRVVVDSKELADWLLEVLRPHLPEQLDNGRCLIELNERLRFLCYTPGQSFDAHLDGNYRRPQGHPRAGDQSQITVQLYLHDVPEGNGGATTFFPGRASAVKHQPEAGSVLLFTQDLEHEGSILTAGLKYTLRTEVM